MIHESGPEICCCPICGRIIGYDDYHRNDVESLYKGYCWTCENNERKQKEICQKEKQNFLP